MVVLVPVEKLRGSNFALRLAIGPSGIWWAIFSLPAAIWLPGVDAAEVNCEQGEEEGISDGWDGTRISRSENREGDLRGMGALRGYVEVERGFEAEGYVQALLLSDCKSYSINHLWLICP